MNPNEPPSAPEENPYAAPSFSSQAAIPQTNVPSQWPKVIGIVAIVFGAGAILGGISGVVTNLLFSFIANYAGSEAEGIFKVMIDWQVTMVISSVIMSLLGGLLLAAGIGMLRRKAWSRTVGIYWAALKILFVVGQSFISYQMQQEQMRYFLELQREQREGGTAMFTGSDPSTAGMAIFQAIFGLAWGWALPVFLLIWLYRKKIREEIAFWNTKVEIVS